MPPLWMFLTVALTLNAVHYPGYGTPVQVISGTILLLLWVLSLFVSFRNFFPK
jgi:hypothetical protein